MSIHAEPLGVNDFGRQRVARPVQQANLISQVPLNLLADRHTISLIDHAPAPNV